MVAKGRFALMGSVIALVAVLTVHTSVAASEDLASERGWTVGDEIPVRFDSGDTAETTLVATYEPVSQFADVLVSYDTVAAHAVDALDGEVLGGVDPLGAWVAWHPEIGSAAQ